MDKKCTTYFKSKDELEKLHTKQLLNLLRGFQSTYSGCDYCRYRDECIKEEESYRILIKEILATHVHIFSIKKKQKHLGKKELRLGNRLYK